MKDSEIMKMTPDERAEFFARKWIQELTEAGCTPEDMIAIFKEAQRQYDSYKKRMTKFPNRRY